MAKHFEKHPLTKVREIISEQYTLTQKDLANTVNYSKDMIWKVESWKTPMSPKLANALDNYLGTNFRDWVYKISSGENVEYEIDTLQIISNFEQSLRKSLNYQNKRAYTLDTRILEKILAKDPKLSKKHVGDNETEIISFFEKKLKEFHSDSSERFKKHLIELGFNSSVSEELKEYFSSLYRFGDSMTSSIHCLIDKILDNQESNQKRLFVQNEILDFLYRFDGKKFTPQINMSNIHLYEGYEDLSSLKEAIRSKESTK